MDGHPGKFVTIEQRSGTKWYIAGINGESFEKKIMLNLAFLKGKTGTIITGSNDSLILNNQPVMPNGALEIAIKPNGGFVITF